MKGFPQYIALTRLSSPLTKLMSQLTSNVSKSSKDKNGYLIK